MDSEEFDLRNLIQARYAGLDPLVNALNGSLLPGAIRRYNSEFSPRYFGRPPSERIRTEPKHLTDFRTRLGTLIEYGLGVVLDTFIQEDYREGDLRLSFVVASQFPDFYMRDATGEVLLRIDAKSLHDESAEYSARFDLPTSEIRPLDDLLLYIAWAWRTIDPGGHELIYPHVLEGLVVPAIAIAEERDRRQIEAGGYFDAAEVPRVPPRRGVLQRDEWKPDTNFGKIDRIVHPSRRDTADLAEPVRAFLDFTQRHADAVRRAGRGEARATPTEDEPVAT